jgi:hypothetical protein
MMDELGLQRDEEYGTMLSMLGRLDLEQGQCKEALAIYDKAKVVLVQYKDESDYGAHGRALSGCISGMRLLPVTRKLLTTTAMFLAPPIQGTLPP